MSLFSALVILALAAAGAACAGPLDRLDQRLKGWPSWLLPTLVLVPLTALYLVHLWAKHRTFETWATDDGLFAQAVWHLSRGEAPASTLLGLPNLWAEHFTPLLVLLAPFHGGVLSLLALQVAAVSAGGYAVWGLGLRWLGSPAVAAAGVVGYLASVPMQNALHFGFHPVTLAIPLLLAALWCAEEQRWLGMGVALLLAGLAQEDALLWVAFFGLALATLRGNRWKGLAVTLLAVLAFALVMQTVLPSFAPEGHSYRFVGLFSRFGDSPAAVVLGVLSRPFEALGVLVDQQAKIRTLCVLLAPGLLLCLLSPWTLVAVPMLAENLLADRPSQWELCYHYAAPAATFLLVASLHGARRLPRLRGALAFALVGTTLLFSVRTGSPLQQRLTGGYRWPDERDARRAELLRRIPEDASVIAQPVLVTHLADRARIQDDDPVSLSPGDPLREGSWECVVYDLSLTTFPYDEAGFRARVGHVLASGYGVEWQEGSLLVLRRGSTGKPTGEWEEFLRTGGGRP